MKNLIMSVVSLILLSGCYGQTEKNKETVEKDTIKPKIDYKVNKVYDEKGNLIKYDSTYTYYYSNIDKRAMINDSIFNKFNEYFNLKNPLLDDSFFNDFFKQEYYLENDFFREDFFRNSHKRNREMMDKMLERMDSIKNQFFLKEYPLEQKGETKK